MVENEFNWMFSVDIEVPISEGYIWVGVDKNGVVESTASAMCLECGDKQGRTHIDVCECTLDNCLNCEYTDPEMIARRERIEKIYEKMHVFLEEKVITLYKEIKNELSSIT